MSVVSTAFREPSDSEWRLLGRLATDAVVLAPGWLDGLLVRELDDGGMGSLRLLTRGNSDAGRRFGATVAEYQFKDSDGVDVIVSLNVDQCGLPFELDMWKTDFSPLIGVPLDL